MAVRKGWLAFFIIFGLFVFMGLMFILGIMAAFEDKPVVKSDTILKMSLGGLITEKFPEDAFGRELEGASLQMHDIRTAVTMAAVDDRIRGIYLRLSNPDIGWAKAQEIKSLLADFKKTNKFVTAFMETTNELSYYIALAADEIYLQPHSYVEFNGFASEIAFLKGTFNKLGMEPQVENIGKYKSAGDVLKRKSMSPAHREVTLAILQSHYDEFISATCESRGLERSAFEKVLDRGLFRAEEAFEEKLVDDLKYETAVNEILSKHLDGEQATNGKSENPRTISISRYAKVPPSEVGLDKGEKIALIYAVGAITSGRSGFHPLMGRSMGSASIVTLLQAAKRNQAVKAIILRVDSPGGSALASDVMWSEIEDVQKEKPVIISMSDLAASGGYWISMGSDAIVAQHLTLTGSIGVVGAIFDMSGTYDKLGMTWETVKLGEHADMITDKRPLTSEEWERFKENTADIYNTFVQKVADGRERSWDEVHEIAQGRVWTGEQALKIGLIDSLGSLDAALAIAKEKAGLTPDEETQWVVYPQPKGFFESLFEKINVRVAGMLKSSRDASLLQSLPGETRAALRQIAVFNSVRCGEILAIAPFIPRIH